MPDPLPSRALLFGPFCFDAANRLLVRDSEVVPLTPKVIDTLELLLVNRGRVMTKEELMRALWPDSFVEDANLSQAIYALRKALGDGYIETLARRGYRFVGEVAAVGSAARPRTLAVLPFRPLVSQSREEALELGIADALVTTLGGSGGIAVRPIAATRRYADGDHDPVAVGRQLAVDAVLDGSIQRSDDTLRVTARLTRTSDGVTLWAARYHETVTNLFDVQDAIADKITAALEPEIIPADAGRMRKRFTRNAVAHQLYLHGRYNFTKGNEEGLRKAIDFYYQAIAQDPGYSLAYVGVAEAFTFLDWYGVLSTRESNPQAFAAAEKGIALDPELAEAHAAMGLARQYRWDWSGAEASFRRSLALNPLYAPARQWFALHLAFRGRSAEALAEIATAQELDPMSLAIRAHRALILYLARRFDEAVVQCRDALRVEPAQDEARLYLALSLIEAGAAEAAVVELKRTSVADTPDVQAMLAIALAAAGRADEAEPVVQRLVAASAGKSYVPHLWIAAAYAALGQQDAALRQLDAAYQDPDDSCAAVGVAVLFDPLRSDPRFHAIQRKFGLADTGAPG